MRDKRGERLIPVIQLPYDLTAAVLMSAVDVVVGSLMIEHGHAVPGWVLVVLGSITVAFSLLMSIRYDREGP